MIVGTRARSAHLSVSRRPSFYRIRQIRKSPQEVLRGRASLLRPFQNGDDDDEAVLTNADCVPSAHHTPTAHHASNIFQTEWVKESGAWWVARQSSATDQVDVIFFPPA